MMKSREFKYSEQDEQSEEGWQITYSSLSLILVVVFAMLISYSVVDKRKMGHLRGAVKEEAGSRKAIETDDGKSADSANIEGDKDSVWISDVVNSLKSSSAGSGFRDDVAVQQFPGGVRLSFKSDMVFPSGTAAVSEKIYPYLDEISGIALERNLSLRVEGHTDDIPISTEEFPSNWELSTKRAVNIVRYLIEKRGFPVERLSAEGFGQYHPLVPNVAPEEKSKNRRIEIYVERGVKNSSGREKSHE
ncbi:MAG: OmpA/MotB family protein [Syntrophales bacterium]